MTSNLSGAAPQGAPGTRLCTYCHTPLVQSGPLPGHPNGLPVSTVSQGMSHRSVCPSRPLSLGYPQAHVMAPAGWTPTGPPEKPIYRP